MVACKGKVREVHKPGYVHVGVERRRAAGLPEAGEGEGILGRAAPASSFEGITPAAAFVC